MSFSNDFLDALRQEVAGSLAARLLERGLGAPAELVDAVALDVAMDVQFHWAGQQVYVQQSSPYLKRRIYNEFDGGNVPELVRRYRLSTKTIYEIIAAERRRDKKPDQALLPGM